MTWRATSASPYSKVWYVRPLDGASAWGGEDPPEVACYPGGDGGARVVEDTVGGERRRRLRIEVEEGDLLLVDTSAWWHETALPQQKLSVSYAREFFLHSEHGMDRAWQKLLKSPSTHLPTLVSRDTCRPPDVLIVFWWALEHGGRTGAESAAAGAADFTNVTVWS